MAAATATHVAAATTAAHAASAAEAAATEAPRTATETAADAAAAEIAAAEAPDAAPAESGTEARIAIRHAARGGTAVPHAAGARTAVLQSPKPLRRREPLSSQAAELTLLDHPAWLNLAGNAAAELTLLDHPAELTLPGHATDLSRLDGTHAGLSPLGKSRGTEPRGRIPAPERLGTAGLPHGADRPAREI